MSLETMKAEVQTAFSSSEAIISAAERGKRPFTPSEQARLNTNRNTVDILTPQIEKLEKDAKANRTISLDPAEARKALRAMGKVDAVPALSLVDSQGRERMCPKRLTATYREEFFRYARLGKAGMNASALYEGSNAAGGFAVPIAVDQYIAPLAPTASDIRSIATVVETDRNMLIPTTAPSGLPTTTLTAELSEFAQSQPALAQTELQAFMNVLAAPVSLQLAEDVPGLEVWMRTVVEAALLEQEDALFVSGSGSSEPQGMIGNVGPGITAEPDGSGNAVSIDGCSTLLGQLKPKYLSGASWLMNQATAIILRKSQVESNVFYPAWSRQDGQDYLHGVPVRYSASMPTAARGNSPILLGNFRMGYIIGDRGGSAISLKVIDQLLASTGTLFWLLYRRTDARVWVSEAIQQYNVSLS